MIRCLLLFGCRDHGEDLFCEETSSLERRKEKGGLTFTRQTAFSRLERKEYYVQVLREIMKKNMLTLYGLHIQFFQDLLWSKTSEILDALLVEGGSLLVCGSVRTN